MKGGTKVNRLSNPNDRRSFRRIKSRDGGRVIGRFRGWRCGGVIGEGWGRGRRVERRATTSLRGCKIVKAREIA
jgi:hypothetical protein